MKGQERSCGGFHAAVSGAQEPSPERVYPIAPRFATPKGRGNRALPVQTAPASTTAPEPVIMAPARAASSVSAVEHDFVGQKLRRRRSRSLAWPSWKALS